MSDKLKDAQRIKDQKRDKIKKRLNQIEIISKMAAALEIQKEFERLFDTLHLIDVDAKIEKWNVEDILKTYRDKIKWQGQRDKLLDGNGDITEL